MQDGFFAVVKIDVIKVDVGIGGLKRLGRAGSGTEFCVASSSKTRSLAARAWTSWLCSRVRFFIGGYIRKMLRTSCAKSPVLGRDCAGVDQVERARWRCRRRRTRSMMGEVISLARMMRMKLPADGPPWREIHR